STLTIAGLAAPAPPSNSGKPKFSGAKQVDLPKVVAKAADGKLTLAVQLKLPEGWKINTEAPMAYLVEAEGQSGPIDREAIGQVVKLKERTAEFEIRVPVKGSGSGDKLKVSLIYYYCQTKEPGLCKVGSVIWTVPVELAADAKEATVPLPYKIEEAK